MLRTAADHAHPLRIRPAGWLWRWMNVLCLLQARWPATGILGWLCKPFWRVLGLGSVQVPISASARREVDEHCVVCEIKPQFIDARVLKGTTRHAQSRPLSRALGSRSSCFRRSSVDTAARAEQVLAAAAPPSWPSAGALPSASHSSSCSAPPSASPSPRLSPLAAPPAGHRRGGSGGARGRGEPRLSAASRRAPRR